MSGRQILSVRPDADMTWAQWVAQHPDHRDWVAERWLAAYRSLPDRPDALATTRAALQTLVTNVITPARYRETGKIGLRWTLGGFGTPFYGDDEQVRVEGDRLVVQRGGQVESAPLTTVGDACRLVLGQDEPDLTWTRDLSLHDVPAEAAPDMPVDVDPDAARFLGEWFGFAYAVLERLRADPASLDASRPQLWPEHFDPAIEVLPGRRRASYGFSPGDGTNPEPYAYVSVWYPGEEVSVDGPLWDAAGFAGAVLPSHEIAGFEGDQVAYVLGWMRARRDALAA